MGALCHFPFEPTVLKAQLVYNADCPLMAGTKNLLNGGKRTFREAFHVMLRTRILSQYRGRMTFCGTKRNASWMQTARAQCIGTM